MPSPQSRKRSLPRTDDPHPELENLRQKMELLSRQLQWQLRKNSIQLERSRSLLSGIMDSINHGVVAVDRKGKVIVFNRAAARMTGLESASVIGKKYAQLPLHREGKGGESPLMTTLTSGERITDGERQMRMVDSDKRLPVRYFTGIISDADNEQSGAVEVFEDLSEIKGLEDRISRGRTLAALGEMAANVAHELRNPLGGIGGYAAMLYEVLEDNPAARQYVQKLIEGVDSLNRVATNLLAFTRPVEPRFYREDLRTVLKEVIGYVVIECEQSGSNIELKTRFPRAPVSMELDSELLRQTFLNLLKNAIQAVDAENGLIKINLERRTGSGNCRISISDNGHGIAEKEQEKLFNPFHTTRTRGTGLGLPIARKNVELHGGTITFKNNRQGGATFYVELPLPEESA